MARDIKGKMDRKMVSLFV